MTDPTVAAGTPHMHVPTGHAELAVSMTGIVKRFPGLVANDHVDFDLRPGEVHALLGENGAGKSTLMNILAGIYRPDEGEIRVRGALFEPDSPRDAIAAGIGMIHQHFTLVPSLTVTENVLLGLDEPRFRLDLREYGSRIAALGEHTGLRVHPEAQVWQLSVGEQQRVEILKMLYRGARVLVMDEPTAVLAPQETQELFRTLRGMTESGGSIVFISHKLDEVLAIADRITVLRRGKVTAAGIPAAGRTRPELARLMVGREVLETIDKPPVTPGPVVLEVHDVRARNDRDLEALHGVSLDLRAGEILGIAGVAGNGQTELAEVITGLRHCTGSILVNGTEVANRPPRASIASGVAHIPEDRHGTGSAPNLSLTDNLVMKSYRSAPSVDTEARLLSGGNLQRLIFAREISTGPSLLVAVQPSRGLDVGAVATVHRLLLARRAAGAAVLLISEDLDEILAIADRVAVIYEGRITGIVDSAGADIEELGLLMTGHTTTGEGTAA